MRLRHIEAGEINGLINFNLELYENEVLLLLGNFISGKEYLRNLLIGRGAEFSGHCFLYEQRVDNNGLRQAFEKHEIFYANPELSLIPGASVAENLMIYRNRRSGLLPSWKSIHLMAEQQLDKLGLDIDLQAKTRELDFFSRLALCIAKADLYDSRIIVIDYPDNKLDLPRIQALGNIIEKLKSKASFLIFSERADEILDLADNVLIVSEGRDKKKYPSSLSNQSEILSLWLEDDKYLSRRKLNKITSDNSMKICMTIDGRDSDISPITGIFDPGRSSKVRLINYIQSILKNNNICILRKNKLQRDESATISVDDMVFIENHDYNKMLSMFPLKYSLVLPRTVKELFSAVNHRHEHILVQEFYEQFEYLGNNDRNYSEIFFWKLAAIFRWERFHPEIMILDNPFVQLDAYEEDLLADYFRHLSERMAIIIIANRISSVDKIAGKIICIDDGRIRMIF